MLSLKTSTVNSSSRTGYTSILVSILKSIAWNSLGKNLISLTEGLPPKAAGCPTTPEVPTRREALLTAPAAKSLQSCRTLCDPIEGSPPGSPVPGILQARTLEWGAMSFSNASKWKVKVKSLSPVRFFETPWTVAYQAPPSMDFPGTSTGVGCHFLLHHEILMANILGWFAIHPPVDHNLSELSAMTRPSWVALHGTAHSLSYPSPCVTIR